LNRIFHSFNSLSSKFSLGNRLIDIFSSYFSLNFLDRKNKEKKQVHICKLNDFILQILAESKIAVIVSDVSIKNQVATSITHIYIHDKPVIKTLHHAINVTSNEAELT